MDKGGQHHSVCVPCFHNYPFLLHFLIECPASLHFFFRPTQQFHLSPRSLSAEAVIKQYAVLLLSNSLLALFFFVRPFDSTSKFVAGAMSMYHWMPLHRALNSWRSGLFLTAVFGNPVFSIVLHTIALLGFYSSFFLLYLFG
jgi:hypothetical protein